LIGISKEIQPLNILVAEYAMGERFNVPRFELLEKGVAAAKTNALFTAFSN
jgi:hypothetical protein